MTLSLVAVYYNSVNDNDCTEGIIIIANWIQANKLTVSLLVFSLFVCSPHPTIVLFVFFYKWIWLEPWTVIDTQSSKKFWCVRKNRIKKTKRTKNDCEWQIKYESIKMNMYSNVIHEWEHSILKLMANSSNISTQSFWRLPAILQTLSVVDFFVNIRYESYLNNYCHSNDFFSL